MRGLRAPLHGARGRAGSAVSGATSGCRERSLRQTRAAFPATIRVNGARARPPGWRWLRFRQLFGSTHPGPSSGSARAAFPAIDPRRTVPTVAPIPPADPSAAPCLAMLGRMAALGRVAVLGRLPRTARSAVTDACGAGALPDAVALQGIRARGARARRARGGSPNSSDRLLKSGACDLPGGGKVERI